MNTIGGYDIKKLAAAFGTPLYVYDADILKNRAHSLIQAFSQEISGFRICYAVKANTNPAIMAIFRKAGLSADCASPVELQLAKLAGFSPSEIMYTGCCESADDLDFAFKSGACVNLDSLESLERLIRSGIPDTISFRINPGVGRGAYAGITTGGTEAKFGIPAKIAAQAYKMAYDAGIRRFGIHMMTGSGNLEPAFFAQMTELLCDIAGDIFNPLGILPEYIDIGGGFGIPYSDDESALDISETARVIGEAFKEGISRNRLGDPLLVLEPGRWLTGTGGVLIAKVTAVKKSYRTFIGLDAGMGTLLRPALYGAKHRVSVYGKEKAAITADICGRICESSDIFMRDAMIPAVEEGDIMVLHDAGAYGFVMSSSYNGRLRPAEVLIENGEPRLIRRRETFEDVAGMCCIARH